MAVIRRTPRRTGRADPLLPWYVRPDDLSSTLVAVTSRALRGADCADLGHLAGPEEPRAGRSAGVRAVPPDLVRTVDAAAAAEWIVAQYDGGPYRGLVCGSAHGGAALLAVALGVPWLPSGFEIQVRWPQGSPSDVDSAMLFGRWAAGILGVDNPGLQVRQVYDPVTLGAAAGWRITLHLRWTALPPAYQRLLDERLDANPFAIVLHDERPWPVVREPDYSFQVGGVASDLTFDEYLTSRELASLLAEIPHPRWPGPDGTVTLAPAERSVEPELVAQMRARVGEAGGRFCSVGYRDARRLSAIVADLYRDWLVANGRAGDRALVTAGRLVDGAEVLAKGVVPYWCENSTSAAVTGAEMWLAGSRPFRAVHVLADPPGAARSKTAPIKQWEALAWFATGRGVVDPVTKWSYPDGLLSPRHATGTLRVLPPDPAPAALSYVDAVRAIMAATGQDLEVDPIG